jgi:hypothetical protein
MQASFVTPDRIVQPRLALRGNLSCPLWIAATSSSWTNCRSASLG